MKVNRKNLFESIKKVLNENEDDDFQKLMDLAKDPSEGSGIQALEMYEYFDLTEKQIRTLYNVVLHNTLQNDIEDLLKVLELRPPEYTDQEMAVFRDMAYKAIVTKTEQPERLLKAMNFDFHNEFAKVYGITPPRNMEFDFRSGADASGGLYHEDGVYLELPTLGGLIMFTFSMEGSREDVPTDPLIYLKNKKGDEIWMDIDLSGNLRYDSDQGETGLSKEEIPDLIRKHMGYATTEPVKGWKELPLGSAAPVRETVNRNYLFQMINEVLREDEDDDAEIEKKINDFIDTEDLEHFITGLSLLDTFEMSGLVEPRKAKDLKMLMYKAAKEGDLFSDNITATYNFIMSDEFTSSFSDEEMEKVKTSVFHTLSGKDLEGMEKLIEWVIDDPEVPFHRYSGSFDLYVIDDIPNQEFVDRVIGKFRELSGQKDYAVFSMVDGPEIFVGDEASRVVNFNPMVKDIFGFKPKSLPNYNFFVGALISEIGYGMPFEMDSSPMFGGKNIDYHFKIRNELGTRWKMTIIFNDGFAGNLEITYMDIQDYYFMKLSKHHKDYTSGEGSNAWVTDNPSEESYTKYNREGMINKVKEMTGIDLTTVGEVNESLSERDLMKEEDDDEDGDGDFLKKLFDLVSAGEVEQAFDLADSLGMEQELIQRVVKNVRRDDEKPSLGLDVSDEVAVSIVESLKDHPDMNPSLKDWLDDEKIGLPFKKVGRRMSDPMVMDYDMYRSVALVMFKYLLKDENNDLNEENFGRESRSDVLEEGWEDQWPSEFGALLRMIKGSINNKSDKFSEALVKIFYRMGSITYIMPIKFVRSTAYSIEHYTKDGIKLHSNKVTMHSKHIEDIKAAPTEDFPQEDKDEQIAELLGQIDLELKILNQYRAFEKLAKDDFYFGRGRRKEVLKQSASILAANPNDKLPAMRYSNKVIKSIIKQLNKWRDKNATFPRVMVTVDAVIQNLSKSIKSASDWAYEKTFEGDLAVLIQFIKNLRGDQKDLGNKLMDLIKNSKDLPQHEFVQKISAFVDENRQNEFIDCKDTEADVPCVFLKLDNGMFWHKTSVDYCEITQAKMSNCGAASDSTGILYNLMSNEGGTTKYYVTLEYSKAKNKVIQVLGKANTMPKEKYWPAITSFFEAMGNPLLDKNAFMHMYGEEDEGMQVKAEVDKKIAEFIEGIGARMIPPPAIDSWDDMKQQIREGYYSNLIEESAFGGRLNNVFKTTILYGYEDDGKVKLLLDIRMVLQTVTNDMWEQWRLTNQPEEIKRMKEYSETNLLKEAIYDAIPEKYVDPAREIHLKYSKSSDPTIKMNSSGAYKMRMSFSFETRTRPWTKARGEYLVENFDQLTEGITNNLKRAALMVLFDIEPKRAALVYPEEAERLAQIEDILGDMGFNEGKKKVKLDRNYLTSMILEVLGDEYEMREKNKKSYHDWMLDFDNPENVILGVVLFAGGELNFAPTGEHEFEDIDSPDESGSDEYVFWVDSKQEALQLQDALRDFYRPSERHIDIGADWVDGVTKVFMSVEKY